MVRIKLKSSPAILKMGKANVIQEGQEICFWALGSFLEAAKEISGIITQKYGFTPTLVDPRFVKPLDTKLLREHATSHRIIITMEDNVLAGGFGSAVLEFLESQSAQVTVKRIGWPDEFIEHGSSVNSLRKKHMLDMDSIIENIESIFRQLNIKQRSLAV